MKNKLTSIALITVSCSQGRKENLMGKTETQNEKNRGERETEETERERGGGEPNKGACSKLKKK